MFKLTYLVVSFFILQTLTLSANAYCESYIYHRKFIEKTLEGLYKVQDFYPTREKRSDPFLLIDEKEAKKEKYTITICGNSPPPPNPIIIEGRYSIYDIDGNIYISGIYKNGIRTGIWKKWYSTGEISTEIIYHHANNFIGKEIEWNKNGLKIAEGESIYIPYFYDYQIRTGNWTIWQWDEKGKLILIGKGSYQNEGSNWNFWCHGIHSYQLTVSKEKGKEFRYLRLYKEIEKQGCISKEEGDA